MISDAVVRGFKRLALETERTAGEQTKELGSKVKLSKGEVEYLAVTKDELLEGLRQCNLKKVEQLNLDATFNGNLARAGAYKFIKHSMLIFMTRPIAVSNNEKYSTDVAGIPRSTTNVMVGERMIMKTVPRGTGSPWSGQCASLIITNGISLHDSVVIPGSIYVLFQTSLTTYNKSNSYAYSYCVIPHSKWDPKKIKLTSETSCPSLNSMQSLANSILEGDRAPVTGLYVDIEGVTVSTSNSLSTLPITNVANNYPICFEACVRYVEQVSEINLLYTLAYN
ncbi:Vp9 [Banna virus]|uniref:Vp9 n=1 Tax=Banna virus TaxID=77763 RepID=Q9YWP1_BANNV|nr:Vp9 [Banna virus]